VNANKFVIKFSLIFAGAQAAWMPPIELWYQGCTISSIEGFCYF